MTAEHESSYYEIALTNRQVLTIFVVLLTCLVAAFFSGVWIGQRDTAEGPLAASAGEPAVAAEAAQMTELNFFSDGPPHEGTGGTGTKAPPRRRAPVPDEEPRQAPAEQQKAPPPEQKAQPPEQKAPPSQPPPAPAPAPKAVAGRVIQVFSTPDAVQADRLVRRLGAGGYPAFLVEESLQGRTTYRVRVGPYQQEARARKVADELRREYRLETWITTQPG